MLFGEIFNEKVLFEENPRSSRRFQVEVGHHDAIAGPQLSVDSSTG